MWSLHHLTSVSSLGFSLGLACVLLSGCGAAGPAASPTAAPAGAGGRPSVVQPSSPALDLNALVRAELDRLSEGMVLFDASTVMRQGQRERVVARLSQNVDEDISKGLSDRGHLLIEPITVGTFMRVRLYGDGFEITALDDEEQVVASDGFTQWAWDVLPTESGRRSLHLTVAVRVKVPGANDQSKSVPVRDKEVDVQVDPMWSLGQFVDKYWQWIASAVVLPFVAWGWQLYAARKDRAAEATDSDRKGRRRRDRVRA